MTKSTLSTLLGVAALFLCLGCSSSDSSQFTDFSQISTDAMPVIESAVEGLTRVNVRTQTTPTCAEDWACDPEQGNMAFQLYRLLADPEDDPGLIHNESPQWGVENLYSNLTILGVVSESLTTAEGGTGSSEVDGQTYNATFPARQMFDPAQAPSPPAFAPFTSLDDVTYAYYRNADVTSGADFSSSIHLAWNQQDGLTNLLMGNTQMPSGVVRERGIYEGQFNDTTGDMVLNVAMWTVQGFLPRWDIVGNTQDHTFEAKYLKRNVIDGYYNLSLVGLGVSEGVGEHYLFKAQEWNTGEIPSGTTYYCISAEATKEHFGEAYGNGGSDEFNDVPGYLTHRTTTPTEGWCGGTDYESRISAIVFGTEEDLPADATNFNSEFLSPYL